MAIERNNSFHLLLSDDELKLLRLLAEREGLNASDYLRSLMRSVAGTPPHVMQAFRLGEMLAGKGALGEAWAAARGAAARGRTKTTAKTRAKKAR
jgi:hypothetical protein